MRHSTKIVRVDEIRVCIQKISRVGTRFWAPGRSPGTSRPTSRNLEDDWHLKMMPTFEHAPGAMHRSARRTHGRPAPPGVSRSTGQPEHEGTRSGHPMGSTVRFGAGQGRGGALRRSRNQLPRGRSASATRKRDRTGGPRRRKTPEPFPPEAPDPGRGGKGESSAGRGHLPLHSPAPKRP